LPNTQCIAASTTEGAYLAEPFHTVFAGQGDIWLGSLDHRPEPAALRDHCRSTQIPCTWTADISEKLWRKLAINCAINPLTVIHDCNNGTLLQHATLINILCDELQRLLNAAQQANAAQHLHQQVWQVIEKTAANSSSMRQDAHHQRRTEISYMTGFACTQSIALACQTPTLHALHTQLQNTLIMLGLPLS
jgi:2-dehydropantoate 2-reductase